MTYDEHLAGQVRDLLRGQIEVEKKMFGGLAFMVQGRMACCVSGQGGLLVKVGRQAFPELVELDDVEPMAMGDTVSDSWVLVGNDALFDERALRLWIDRGLAANPPQPRPQGVRPSWCPALIAIRQKTGRSVASCCRRAAGHKTPPDPR